MLLTNMLIRFVIQTSLHHWHFVVHTKKNGIRGLSKHYHMQFDPKLLHGICVIFHIPCAYAECTSMIDKPCIHGLTSKQQPIYQPVIDYNYWSVLPPLTNVISPHCHTKPQQVRLLRILIRFYLMASVTIWPHWFNLVSMVPHADRCKIVLYYIYERSKGIHI